jgi:hypothetical protein
MYSPKSLAPDRARFPVTLGVFSDALIMVRQMDGSTKVWRVGVAP